MLIYLIPYEQIINGFVIQITVFPPSLRSHILFYFLTITQFSINSRHPFLRYAKRFWFHFPYKFKQIPGLTIKYKKIIKNVKIIILTFINRYILLRNLQYISAIHFALIRYSHLCMRLRREKNK